VHHKNRRRALRGGTHPRAFTLIELGVAVLVFTLIAGVVTIAVAGATVSGAKDRLENAVSGELRTLVATTVSGPYDYLVKWHLSFQRKLD
jgi:type II secretory pathway pseudopilin PulG